MALNSRRARQVWGRAVDPVGAALARAGVTANGMTTAGLALTAVAGWLVVRGEPVAAGWVLVAGGLADLFDGSVARARGEVTVAGGFYDSVADRLSDGLVLGALAWVLRGEPAVFALAVVALVAAEVTSYIRAKAESLGVTCEVGLVERGERGIALMAGLVFHRWLLAPVLLLLAVGGVATVAQRFVHVFRKLDRGEIDAPPGTSRTGL